MEKFYITTPIYYVNDKPHIGHAYTTIIADVLAHFWRTQIGEDNVFFLTGTDEHGAKIAEAAEKNNISPQKFTDNISTLFKEAWHNLEISNDYFVRTTDENHKKIVVDILKTLKQAKTPQGNDVLYEGEYEGLYCIGCEKFITASELVDDKCPDHNKVPEKLSEKNWFFKLSDFLPSIKEKIESGELIIYPEGRKKEVLGLIKQGVPDISISRSNKSVSWGIDIPWDKDQKTYVWVDALSNYITALEYPAGENFKKFWPADVHLMGLEILKFHTLLWPAMLMALGVELPKSMYIHGFFTIDGKKMSKTLGNVIDPNELVNQYGAEVSKYLILSQFAFGAESDIKIEDFPIKYNADLVNGLGNLVNRVTNMVEQYMDGKIDVDFKDMNLGHEELKQLHFREALLTIWQVIAKDNSLIDQEKPWVLAKDKVNGEAREGGLGHEANKEKLTKILQELTLDLYNIALSLKPFMPKKSKEILDIITAKQIKKPSEPLFPRLQIK